MQNNTNVLAIDIKDFKTMFNGGTNLGLPLLWDGNAEFYSKEECMNTLKGKRNEEPKQELEGVINCNQTFERLRPIFHIWTKLKVILFMYL